jgi:hypothetical protein
LRFLGIKETIMPRFANLQHAINSIPDGLFWLIGKGKVRADEPLYAIQIMDQQRRVLAEAEDDSLIEAISMALNSLNAPVGRD